MIEIRKLVDDNMEVTSGTDYLLTNLKAMKKIGQELSLIHESGTHFDTMV